MNIETKIKLNNNTDIPVLGLGTYQSNAGNEAFNAVMTALELGYRHIDTAALYGNEEDIGRAVRDCGFPRNEIFITTKLWNSDHGKDKAKSAFYRSLDKLKTDYVDLYLIHWPVSYLRLQSWDSLTEIYKDGLCKALGVSNYSVRHLNELLSHSDLVPAVNQVEFSPYLYQKELQDFCSTKEIFIEAYTPLIRGKKFGDPKLVKMAGKYNKTQSQILIRWALQAGTIVLPKSVNRQRISENADVFDFEISSEDMEILNDFNENFRVAWNPESVV